MIQDAYLHYFTSNEYRQWWDSMNPALVVRVDVFRGLWGAPVDVSGHCRALGRHNGSGNASDHNVDNDGMVNAVDVFPRGLRTQKDAARAMDAAMRAGIGSIGLYPHWGGGVGLHLGVRVGRGGSNEMARWGAVLKSGVQTYVSWEEALDQLPE